MSISSRTNHTRNHTVILKPRVSSAPLHQKYGSISSYDNIAVHSKPKPPPHSPQKLFLASPRNVCRTRMSSEIFLEHESPANSLLVRFGLDSYLGRMVTRVLILLMLFQPVYVAMGMELEETSNSTPSQAIDDIETEVSNRLEDENIADTMDDIETEVSDGLEDKNIADISEANSTTEVDTVTVTEEETETGEIVAEVENMPPVLGDEDDLGTVSEVDTVGTDPAEEDAVGDVPEMNENVTNSEVGPSLSDGSGTDFEIDSSADEDTEEIGMGEESIEEIDENDVESDFADESLIESATSSDEAIDTNIPSTQNLGSTYIFGEGDCTLVSEGEFYCVATGPERQVSTGDPRVYAEKDREGDKEIYYFDGVEVHRITNNSYDDFAPVFDDETLRIVWQAMLNDRLQIMVHEIPTQTTRQVTKNRQNSTNPSIAGDTIVWQEWIDTNWEIMMTDVDNEGQEFDIEQLTDNVVHDMFPAAYDGLITWQSERGSSWEVVVYDMRTEKKHILEKSENTKYENPRFALLFDSKHDNGDVETIGYDLETGEMTELGTKANPKPFIPVTPKEEVPEAIPQATNSTTTVSKEDMDSDGDPIVE